eukprot:COSAG04_NODE_6589_length_1298_cov_1.777314_1_plen_95_part_10
MPPHHYICPLAGELMRDPVEVSRAAPFELKPLIIDRSNIELLEENAAMSAISLPGGVGDLRVVPQELLRQRIGIWRAVFETPRDVRAKAEAWIIR